MTQVLSLKKTSKKTLIRCLQALAHLGGASPIPKIAEWMSVSITTARHAIRILQHCGLVTVTDGVIKAVVELPHPLSNESAANILATTLSRTNAFTELAALLNCGYSQDDSIRRAVLVEPGLVDTQSGHTLIELALDFGLLERSNDGGLVVTELIKTPIAEFVPKEMDPAAAQIALRQLLGPDTYRNLKSTERDRLGRAIQYIRSDPEQACVEAGKAVENYLRLIANDAQIDVSECNGLAQVADRLSSKTARVILSQHRVMAHQIAMARNASGHDRDKRTLNSWEKTEGFAHANVLLAARLIASIYAWRTAQEQIL